MVLVILILAGLIPAGISVLVKKQSVSQVQSTPDLNVQIVEIGASEVQLLQPVSETPIPAYHLNSSRMFTILYLKLNFTGTTTVDGKQLSGQPTVIMDGAIFPIRSRYNGFRMFLTLTQGTHIISLVNIGISGNAGEYAPTVSHTSFLVHVGSQPKIPSLTGFQASYELNITYDPNRGFNRQLAHLDKAFVQPRIIEGNYSVFNATLEGTGFVGDLDSSAFTPVQGITFLQTADGMRNISVSGTVETMAFGNDLPIANFISMYPIGYGSTSQYGNMSFFGLDAVSFRGISIGSTNTTDVPSTSTGVTTGITTSTNATAPTDTTTEPTTTKDTTTEPATPTDTTNGISTPTTTTIGTQASSSASNAKSETSPVLKTPILSVPIGVAVSMVILRRKKK